MYGYSPGCGYGKMSVSIEETPLAMIGALFILVALICLAMI